MTKNSGPQSLEDAVKTEYRVYNEETKISYLKTVENQPKLWERIAALNAMAPFEEALQRDLGEMSREEVLDALGQTNVSAYNGIIARTQFIKEYRVWYSDEIKPMLLRDNSFSWSDVDLKPRFKVSMIHDLEEIPNAFSTYKPEDGYYMQPILVLAWYGLTYKASCALKKEAVTDGSEMMIVTSEGHSIEVRDKTALRILRSYCGARYKPRQTRIPSNNNWFIYDLITETSKHDGQMDSIRALSRMNGIFNRIPAEQHPERFVAPSLINAGHYTRVLEWMDACGIEKLEKEHFVKVCEITGRKFSSYVQRNAFARSVEAYKG